MAPRSRGATRPATRASVALRGAASIPTDRSPEQQTVRRDRRPAVVTAGLLPAPGHAAPSPGRLATLPTARKRLRCILRAPAVDRPRRHREALRGRSLPARAPTRRLSPGPRECGRRPVALRDTPPCDPAAARAGPDAGGGTALRCDRDTPRADGRRLATTRQHRGSAHRTHPHGGGAVTVAASTCLARMRSPSLPGRRGPTRRRCSHGSARRRCGGAQRPGSTFRRDERHDRSNHARARIETPGIDVWKWRPAAYETRRLAAATGQSPSSRSVVAQVGTCPHPPRASLTGAGGQPSPLRPPAGCVDAAPNQALPARTGKGQPARAPAPRRP